MRREGRGGCILGRQVERCLLILVLVINVGPIVEKGLDRVKVSLLASHMQRRVVVLKFENRIVLEQESGHLVVPVNQQLSTLVVLEEELEHLCLVVLRRQVDEGPARLS